MLGNSGSTPERLFQGHLHELIEALDEDRTRIKQLLEEEMEKDEDAAAGKKRFMVQECRELTESCSSNAPDAHMRVQICLWIMLNPNVRLG